MTTLNRTLNKYVKSGKISQFDADQIKQYYDQHISEGYSAAEAKQGAVADYLKDVEAEHEDIINQVKEKIGKKTA